MDITEVEFASVHVYCRNIWRSLYKAGYTHLRIRTSGKATGDWGPTMKFAQNRRENCTFVDYTFM